jgi:hypothetical protein
VGGHGGGTKLRQGGGSRNNVQKEDVVVKGQSRRKERKGMYNRVRMWVWVLVAFSLARHSDEAFWRGMMTRNFGVRVFSFLQPTHPQTDRQTINAIAGHWARRRVSIVD